MDRIPDPPTVLQKKTLDIVRASHHPPIRPAAYTVVFDWASTVPPEFPAAVIDDVANFDAEPAAFGRLAGDSSPPRSILL
jgi:hypothetical protein